MHPNELYRKQVQPALQLKCKDFELMGYNVNEEGIWSYFVDYKWRKQTNVLRLYQVVNEILMLKISDYMNFASLDVIKRSGPKRKGMQLNKEDLKDLI